MPASGCAIRTCGSFCMKSGDGLHGHVLGGEVHDDEAVRPDPHFHGRWPPLVAATFTPGPPGTMVTARPRYGYSPFGERFIEPAMLRLGSPVGGETDARSVHRPACLAAGEQAVSRIARTTADNFLQRTWTEPSPRSRHEAAANVRGDRLRRTAPTPPVRIRLTPRRSPPIRPNAPARPERATAAVCIWRGKSRPQAPAG